MRKNKHKTIRRDVVFEDPDQLAQGGRDSDNDAIWAEQAERPESDFPQERAEEEMFAMTERAE